MLERAIGVPHLIAGVKDVALVPAGDQAVLEVHVGEVGDLGRRRSLADDAADGRLQGTEAAAEADLLLVGEGLTTEEQHRIVVEGVDDLLERPGVDVLHVHAEDLDAEQRMQRARGQCHRRFSSPGPSTPHCAGMSMSRLTVMRRS
jgi:hypothetical protein